MSFEIAKANGRDSTYKVVLDLGDWAQREDTAILNLEAKITKLLEGVRGQWSWVHTNQEQDAPNKRRTSINLLLETQPPPELIQFLSYVNRSYLLAYDEKYFSARGGLFEIPSLILELRTPKESQNKKYIIKYSLSHVPGSHTTAAAYQLAPEVTREVLPYVESLVLWFIRTDGIALTKTYPIEFQNYEAEPRPGGFIIHNAERSREVGRVEPHHSQGKLVYWALFEYSPVPPTFQKKLTFQNDKAE
jgi:hypothetical protein